MIMPVGGLISKLIKKKKKIKVGSEAWNKKWKGMSGNKRISAITGNSEVKKWYDNIKRKRRGTLRKQGKRPALKFKKPIKKTVKY